MHAFEISRSGMDVEWRRLEVIAQNMANAGTTRTENGTAYQPVRLVSGPQFSFEQTLQNIEQRSRIGGVQVYGVESMNVAPRRVYEPAHPHADSNGFVSYPGLDHASEMALMVKTSRAYEANVVTMNAARSMYMKALELGNR